LLPVFILVVWWSVLIPFSSRFLNSQTALLSIGRISGLVGLELFAVSLMVHHRIGFLRYLLDGAYIPRLHHDLGSWSLVFLLVHPIALAMRFAAVNWYVAARFLLPVNNLVNLVGLIALLIMMMSMMVTYYYKSNHALWLWVHRMMLVSYVGAFIHILLVTSDTSVSAGLKYYILLLMIFGILAFAYQRYLKYVSKHNTATEVQ